MGHKLSNAGSKLSVVTKLMSIPAPEIMPSSDTPLKEVGTKAKKPAEVVMLHSSNEVPTSLAVSCKAAKCPIFCVNNSLYLKQK